MDIGERIRNRRKEMDMTQDQLAAKAGFKNRSAISKLETAGNDVTMRQVKRIAECLDTTPAYLMGWSDIVCEIPLSQATERNPGMIPDDVIEDMIKNRTLSNADTQMIEILRIYRMLSDTKRNKVYDYIIDLSKVQDYENENKK